MNLEKIQEMWERDATIDPDNLHNESLKIPQLHSKYYTIYNTISLLREKARDSYNRIRLERYNYYTGKAPAEVYVEDPFPYKVREKDAIQRHMEADEKLSTADRKRLFVMSQVVHIKSKMPSNGRSFNQDFNYVYLGNE